MAVGNESILFVAVILGWIMTCTLIGAIVMTLRLREARQRERDKDEQHEIVLERLRDNECRLRAIIESEPECVKLQAADGTEAYSRCGDLLITPAGLLQNGDGLPVLGENGPITVPAGSLVSIAPDGGVLVVDPAQPDLPAQRVARLKLASPRGSEIEKGLDGLFRVRGGGVLPNNADAKVIPGALEQSNVVPSEVLVDMIEAQRLFEIRTNIVSTARDLDEGSARLMRLDG